MWPTKALVEMGVYGRITSSLWIVALAKIQAQVENVNGWEGSGSANRRTLEVGDTGVRSTKGTD